MIKEFSAGLVLYTYKNNTREYLLLHYQSGHWDFPKGHIEPGESKYEAALRELKEETGLEATILDGFEESFSYFHHLPKTEELAHKTVYFFIGVASSKEVILSHEHINYVWLSFKEALKQLTYDNAQELLQKADDFLNKQS
ncbi:MAG: bis(5'-nucleosyl)-tetraphosphatase [Candidatus Babeliales bacterium]